MAQDAEIHVLCSLCGSDNYKVIYPSTIGRSKPTVDDYVSTIPRYGEYNDIVRCQSCGLVYMNPRDTGIGDLYCDVVDDDYIESWKERASTFRNLLKLLEKIKPQGDLLDIGCYAGIFPNEAIKKGYRVTGIEPSRWASGYAREKTGTNIITGTWDKVSLEKSSFDIVTMWDVVEHLEDPAACFSFIYDRLKVNGIVLVTTHDIESLFARLMGRKYPWLMRFHLYHFSPKTLSAMLSKAGLKPVLTKYFSKSYSLKYLLSRFGLRANGAFFEKIKMPVYTGDMFLIAARKE
jgi:2-polyprenyl-3-methyl-5-hydroxy-6-metoxy-1,4-benzoquinol methylase